MLSTSFWAVPAFKRVEPVSTSGPGTTSIATSAYLLTSAFSLHALLTFLAWIHLLPFFVSVSILPP